MIGTIPKTTSEFAEACQQFSIYGDHRWRGDRMIAEAMAMYLKKRVKSGQIPEYGRNTCMMFTHYIAKYLDDMWEFFRTSGDIDACDFRHLYKEEFKEEIPSLTEINSHLNGGGLKRNGAILSLSTLVDKIVGEEDHRIENNIRHYFYAQDTTLVQQFQRFVRLVYKQGLADLINASDKAGMSGTFGNTDLRTFCSAGRIMITFAKANATGDDDENLTFVGEEKEMQGKRFGIQSVYVNLGQAISMINEVINNWPTTDPSKQKSLFKDNSNVSMG